MRVFFEKYIMRRKRPNPLRRDIDDFNKTPLKINIPERQSIELVSYYDEFKWYYPNSEMKTRHWCVKNIKNDWTIIDCGANIGSYSILFSLLAPQGLIYAVEPTITIRMLEKNLQHNQIRNVVLCNVAMGKKSGKIRDGIYRIWGQDAEIDDYPFLTLDEFVLKNKLERLDCIKIDVDSYDFEVLQGAKETLIKFNPWLLVELNHALNKRGQSNTQALHWLAQHGYTDALVLDDENFIMRRDPDYHASQPSKTISLGWEDD